MPIPGHQTRTGFIEDFATSGKRLVKKSYWIAPAPAHPAFAMSLTPSETEGFSLLASLHQELAWMRGGASATPPRSEGVSVSEGGDFSPPYT
ncbi:MAG TPA: hypothetical protein VFT64_03775 [Rickettsiales bacterium]|nr:hypothetical protein [Rickettsiales bacterium]